jgi:hypothetical protein
MSTLHVFTEPQQRSWDGPKPLSGSLPDSGIAAGAGPSGSDPAAPFPPGLPFAPAAGESDRAWEAFRAYLELGPQRRYAAAASKVGVTLRTVERWARAFDWRGRVKACAAQGAAQYTQTQAALQHTDLRDAAAHAQAFRDRQYRVAEALLGAAERYLQRALGDEVDTMRFADVCKALEVASRIEQQASARAADHPAASARNLGEQLAALLDQVCPPPSAPSAVASPPSRAPSPLPQPGIP